MKKTTLLLMCLFLFSCARQLSNGQVSVNTLYGGINDQIAAAQKACGTSHVSFVGKSDGNHAIYNCY